MRHIVNVLNYRKMIERIGVALMIICALAFVVVTAMGTGSRNTLIGLMIGAVVGIVLSISTWEKLK